MLPKRLQKGDTIGIVSPSGPVTENLKDSFYKGIKFFQSLGFKVKIAKNVFNNSLGYSARPKEKADDINSMFADEEVNAIVCSQGGGTQILFYLC